ncbi:MAG: hypothetical protein JWR26_3936 [Pedosphaera sp.]|nr:hypothetical protein [Pedosphaera sp.]
MDYSHAPRRYPRTIMACFVVLLIGTAFFNSGCTFIAVKRLSKPVGPYEFVRYGTTDNAERVGFRRHFNSPDFNYDVAALNVKDRFEIFCWFYVLPMPEFWFKADAADDRLTIQIQLEPREGNLLFEPSRTFYSGTNMIRIAPVGILRQENYSSYEVTANKVLVKTNTFFQITYKVNDNPDTPFEVSVEGCSVDGKEISLPPIVFKPTTIVRPGIRLPY